MSFLTSSKVWRGFGLSVRVPEYLVVVIATTAAALVVHVLDDRVLVVVVLHEQGHVDDDLLVVAAAAAARQDQRGKLCHADDHQLERTHLFHYFTDQLN